MIDNGIGTGLVFMLIIGGCVIHGLVTKQIYWDRQERQFKMKNSPADGTARRVKKKYSTIIISNSGVKRKVGR